jgi:small-conductance mechanosensitive channel
MLDSLRELPTWVVAVGYVAVALTVAAIVRALLRRWLARLVAAQGSAWSRVLAGSLPRPLAIATFLFMIGAGIRWMPLPDPITADVRKYLPIAIGIVGISLVMRVALRSIDAYGEHNPELRSTAGIGRAAAWIVGLAAIAIFVSDALGISLAPALTALGVGSLAVGLGLQDTLSNFFAGIYLLADKPVRPGEFIKIDGGQEGFVEAIGWRSTQLRTMGGNLVIVPNATLSKAVIINYDRPTRALGIDVRVDVSSDNDADLVERLLAEEAARAVDIPGVVAESPPSVQFAPGLGDGFLGFSIYLQVRSYADQGAVKHALRKRVLARLRDAKVKLVEGPILPRRVVA